MVTTKNAQVQVPVMPIELVTLLARARKANGSTVDEKIFEALKSHDDTANWLEALKPHAFEKGAVVKAVPAAKSKWEVKARDAVIRAAFAVAKNVKSGEVSIPGRAGKVFLREEDMLDPAVQYGLSAGDIDYSGLAALHSLNATSFTLDAEGIQSAAEYAERQKDWAHGEHPLQAVDSDLKALGIFADDPNTAALMLQERGNPDPDLYAQVVALATEHDGNPMRDYGTFKATAWYAPDQLKGRSIQAKPLPSRVRETLKGALLITGSWNSLNIPRQKKAEAFDRMVDLFEAALKRQQPKVVAANTDDLIGKAAIMAAKRLNLHTVAVQLAGWDFKPARMQAQYCEHMPKGHDVQYARDEQSVMLAEFAATSITLGKEDEVLTHNLRRQGKVARSLTPAWVKNNGLY